MLQLKPETGKVLLPVTMGSIGKRSFELAAVHIRLTLSLEFYIISSKIKSKLVHLIRPLVYHRT